MIGVLSANRIDLEDYPQEPFKMSGERSRRLDLIRNTHKSLLVNVAFDESLATQGYEHGETFRSRQTDPSPSTRELAAESVTNIETHISWAPSSNAALISRIIVGSPIVSRPSTRASSSAVSIYCEITAPLFE